MLDWIIALLAPYTCIGCGKEGALVCEWCSSNVCSPVPSRCYRCNATTNSSATCTKCRRNTALKNVWVASQYEGASKLLVHALKFGRTKSAAKLIAAYLDEMVPSLPKDTVITFVPTATSRVRQRGYDHAHLIAKEFARIRGHACTPLLDRLGQARQVGASRKQRLLQAEKSYMLSKDPPKGVLVIDDILTTGATIEIVSRLLKEAGAQNVSAVVFAQKQ